MQRLLFLLSAGAVAAWSHDIITTPITFDREIARIIYAHCASCHHEGGAAFSLMTYKEARPWAEAIKDEVLGDTMPPWGAVKGFGDFRNDQALTPEQIELIVNWNDGGKPEGEEKDLPHELPKFEALAPKALFDPRIARGAAPLWASFGYDVAADGRFLVDSVSTGPESSAVPITVWVNWLAALKR